MEGKRGFIAELIRKLAAQQNPDKEFSFPQLNFLNPENEGEESEDEGVDRKDFFHFSITSSAVRRR